MLGLVLVLLVLHNKPLGLGLLLLNNRLLWLELLLKLLLLLLLSLLLLLLLAGGGHFQQLPVHVHQRARGLLFTAGVDTRGSLPLQLSGFLAVSPQVLH